LSKQELMDAVWPNIHVGDDSLFQCIREIRTALGDDERQLIKLVSGQGYLFTAEVSIDPATTGTQGPLPVNVPPAEAGVTADAPPRGLFGVRRSAALAVVGCCAIVALAVAATMVVPGIVFGHRPPTIAVMPITAADGDGETTAMAANVTTRLADGMAKIGNIRVSAPSAAPQVSANGLRCAGRTTEEPGDVGRARAHDPVRDR
jgi:Transcriptional regulatory protein, C terminal